MTYIVSSGALNSTHSLQSSPYLHIPVLRALATAERVSGRLKQCGKQLLTIPPQILRHQWSAADWTIS